MLESGEAVREALKVSTPRPLQQEPPKCISLGPSPALSARVPGRSLG